MAFSSLNLLLTGVSTEVARLSAEAMIGSFLQAAFVVVIPAAFILLWASQKDALTRR